MEFGIKDGLFIIVYLATVVTLWNGFHHDIVDNAKDIKTNSDDIKKLSDLFKKVMFSETGGLLFTTNIECEKTKDKMSGELQILNKNVIAIMCHLQIQEPDKLFQAKGNHD